MVDFEVVTLPETDHVAEGDTAPDFTRPLVTAEFWEDVSLSTLAEDGPVLLAFYPMDGAFQATYLWQAVAERGWDDRDDVQVVGCSISTPYDHKRLLAEREVDVPLFSDPTNEVAEEYGIVNDLDGMAGITEPRTAVFLLDTDRTVTDAWVASEHPDFPPYEEIESAIEDR